MSRMPKQIALTSKHVTLLRRIETAGTLILSQLTDEERNAVTALHGLGWAVTLFGRISLTNNGRNCLQEIDSGGRETIT